MERSELLTVGQLAAQMGVTVRTLQYYDREGLLKPCLLYTSSTCRPCIRAAPSWASPP